MRLHFVDCNPEIVRAWKSAFVRHPKIDISEGDLLTVATTCVVSPANSYGFMDGGIDAQYTQFFGLRPQTDPSARSLIAPVNPWDLSRCRSTRSSLRRLASRAPSGSEGNALAPHTTGRFGRRAGEGCRGQLPRGGDALDLLFAVIPDVLRRDVRISGLHLRHAFVHQGLLIGFTHARARVRRWSRLLLWSRARSRLGRGWWRCLLRESDGRGGKCG